MSRKRNCVRVYFLKFVFCIKLWSTVTHSPVRQCNIKVIELSCPSSSPTLSSPTVPFPPLSIPFFPTLRARQRVWEQLLDSLPGSKSKPAVGNFLNAGFFFAKLPVCFYRPSALNTVSCTAWRHLQHICLDSRQRKSPTQPAGDGGNSKAR